MFGIDLGIAVYYQNKKGAKDTVFFPNGSVRQYAPGGILFEMISDEGFYLATDKVLNMIRCYPGYGDALTLDSVTDGFRWLHGAVEDDELPVVTELVRSCFSEVIHELADDREVVEGSRCVGEFFEACYGEYFKYQKALALYFDALAADASGVADNFQADLAADFKQSADEMYAAYVKKCSVRHKGDTYTVEPQAIVNQFHLLEFEYCRLKREKKAVKICANCGRYFIPLKRADSIYCSAPSPQNPAKKCSEIGTQAKRAEKRRTDANEREHHNKRSAINMAAKRARDNGEEDMLMGYYERMKAEEQKRYEAAKAESKAQGGA